MLSHFSHVGLFVTPWTVAYQAPQFMGFFSQEYWNRLCHAFLLINLHLFFLICSSLNS